MANSEVIEPLKDNVIVVKGKTFQEEGDFAAPFFGLGIIGSLVVGLVMGMTDLIVDFPHMFSGTTYLFALTPMLNVLAFWPSCYAENTTKKLKELGYKGKNAEIGFGKALKSWYHLPTRSKKVQLGKAYLNLGFHPTKVNGELDRFSAPMGKATHEVTDYLVTDFRGIRMERHVEPTPLMLWDDALNTIDEGFGLKKIS